jgi:integrase
MGRRAKGWKCGPKPGTQYLYVRFTYAGREHFVSTGEVDPRRAADAAAQIYADTVAGKVRAAKTKVAREPLDVLIAGWIESITGVLDATTVKTYQRDYAKAKWLTRWKTLADMAQDGQMADYAADRLRAGMAKTLRKELSAMFGGFYAWCVAHEYLSEDAVPKRPKIAKKLRGTRVGTQREKAPRYSERDIEAAIAALPVWGRSRGKEGRYPLRARFTFAYETGLRPETIDSLIWADWTAGMLRIRDEIDKNRFGRSVPLSDRAESALLEVLNANPETIINGPGLIFGRIDARASLVAAAKLAGLPSLAPYDFRHSRSTHLVDAGAPLTGISHLLGTGVPTLSRVYVHPGPEAAQRALVVGSRAVAVQSAGSDVRRTRLELVQDVIPLEPESSETPPSRVKTSSPESESGHERPARASLGQDSRAGARESEERGPGRVNVPVGLWDGTIRLAGEAQVFCEPPPSPPSDDAIARDVAALSAACHETPDMALLEEVLP